METELVSRLGALLEVCLRCGQPSSAQVCPSCGGPSWSALATVPVPSAPFGQLVQGRLSLPRRRGVAVEWHPDRWSILQPDGTTATVGHNRFRVVAAPPGYERIRSPAGALLAAAGLELPAGVREALWHRALAMVGANPVAVHALAADCAALGLTHLLAALPLSPAEQTWWRAVSMWRFGRWPEATGELLTLPAGRYPQRLVLWQRAAAGRLLPEAIRPGVAAAAKDLAAGSPAATVAAELLLRELGERAVIVSDAQFVAAVSGLGGQQLTPWLSGQPGESTAARLLGAWSQAATSNPVSVDPSILDEAPLAVLDDLIDRGRVPEWSDRLSSLRCGRYLQARTSIASLDDAALAGLGAHDERARRSIVGGKPLPADLPPPVVERFAVLKAAIDGDGDALATIAGAAGLDSGLLRAAMADPGAAPAPELLADGSLARWLLARTTADPVGWPAEGLDERQRRFAAVLAMQRAKDRLYQWDWSAALDAARACLRFARTEDLRDEAQNLLAAAHWQLGNDGAASAALGAALDGEYTAALQVNFAVVAAELEPQQTAAHLSRLVRDAPDLPLRVSAANQAVRHWRSDEQWQHGEPLPAELAGALRALVVAPLEYEAFRELVRLLATNDHEWLAAPGSLDQSPHRQTLAARIWTANARGPDHFIRALASELRGSPEKWVEELRDQLLRDLVSLLNPPGPDKPWSYGVVVLENKLPMAPELRAVLLTLTVSGLLTAIDPVEAEPAPKFLEWLEQAALDVGRLPADQSDSIGGLLAIAFYAIINTYVEARRHQLAQAYQLYQSIQTQASAIPRHMLNRDAVRVAAEPGVKFCRETQALLERLARNAPSELNPTLQDLKNRCLQLRQSFHKLYS